MQKIINCGSLNIDYVYGVPHIVRPGETISGSSFERYCGGKGANQSVALANAGAIAAHTGRIGKDGGFLIDKLQDSGVDTKFIFTGDTPTGHAIIQVAPDGENSIVLFPGANRQITPEQLDAALSSAEPGDILLLQNETNINAEAINKAAELEMKICLNPAPFDDSIKKLPLDKVDVLIVNEIEAQGLSCLVNDDDTIPTLSRKYPGADIVITLGSRGALCITDNGEVLKCPGTKVDAVDTTAAGDTFIGYFLAGKLRGLELAECLRFACAAAAICVTRKGAMDSIPRKDEVDSFHIR